jgi:hypothetical protein
MRPTPLPAILVAAALALPAAAVITRTYPLGDVIADADEIAEARVRRSDARRAEVTLSREAVLKGKPSWSTLRVRLTEGDDRTQVPAARRRLAAGARVILFSKRGRFALAYSDGAWLRLQPPVGPAKPWRFVHMEPFLRRTYRGSAADLRRVVTDVLAGRARAPEPDASVPPGF